MAAETFEVDISGYLLEADKERLPSYPGIYFVYEGTFNKETDNVTIQKLIYIGETNNLNDRILSHEMYDEWKNHVGEGNTLCYSTGRVPRSNRKRVQAAFIYKHKPPLNEEFIDNFPFDRTTVDSSGRTACLDSNFTVDKTQA